VAQIVEVHGGRESGGHEGLRESDAEGGGTLFLGLSAAGHFGQEGGWRIGRGQFAA
jgi:hypothetical protein